ncbi:MAG: NAD(P)/FAD-dependent oxidoreductase [Pyrinomonadaceae bacterium]
MQADVVVIGGGAAGLFCAAEAARRGRRTIVLEHNREPGRKILISGGGRCNFTNTGTRPENFISQNPHFAKSALARYTPDDFVELVNRHRIQFYEKKLGQLFCRESSRQIVTMLLDECERAGADVRCAVSVRSVEKENDFLLDTTIGPIRSESVVIATGGLSYPKIGATDLGYRIAEKFGLAMTPMRPSLVALVAARQQARPDLAGISIDAVVSTGSHSFRENVLFTHRGLSGPAILQISNYWRRDIPVDIDLLPDISADELLLENAGRKEKLSNFLTHLLPERFAAEFVRANSEDRPLNQIGRKELAAIGKRLNKWNVTFRDTEGYDRAEVTLGGVATDELHSRTMEAARVPGLYFIGEVVDVTGWLGGYNFQWAWASGHAAGQAV